MLGVHKENLNYFSLFSSNAMRKYIDKSVAPAPHDIPFLVLFHLYKEIECPYIIMALKQGTL